MLRQASVRQLREGAISRAKAHIAICMCLHPRGMPGELRDEFLSILAPDRNLFRDWKSREAKVGHEAAFRETNYEERFQLPPEALVELRRLIGLSREKIVYLVCQCAVGERCHREILLLTAKAMGAETGNVYHRYPVFEARLPGIIGQDQAG